jgi:hypothetical protein
VQPSEEQVVLHPPLHPLLQLPVHPVVHPFEQVPTQVPWHRPVQLALHPESLASTLIDSSVETICDIDSNVLTGFCDCVSVKPLSTIALTGTIILLKCSVSGIPSGVGCIV